MGTKIIKKDAGGNSYHLKPTQFSINTGNLTKPS
jgi:hypothetical protein